MNHVTQQRRPILELQQGLIPIGPAAQILGVSVHTVRLWVRQRRIPFVRLSTAIRFSTHSLEQFIEEHAVLPIHNPAQLRAETPRDGKVNEER